jgi:septal ring factor EnvC (AmiA/AmiB activator)
MERASEVILALRPVTFHYKSDAKGTSQFGLIAEEVAKVNSALVLPDKEGKPYTVRYDAVNAMLLNEFLKEHRKVEQQAREMQEQQATIAELKSDAVKQEATISQLKKEMESVVACLKEHDSRIQKVSTKIEVGEPFARTALNNQ